MLNTLLRKVNLDVRHPRYCLHVLFTVDERPNLHQNDSSVCKLLNSFPRHLLFHRHHTVLNYLNFRSLITAREIKKVGIFKLEAERHIAKFWICKFLVEFWDKTIDEFLFLWIA